MVLINLCGTFVIRPVRMGVSRQPECHSRDLPCHTLLHGAMPSNFCDRHIPARQPLDRRSLLTRSALGLGALGLAQVLQDDGRVVAAEAATDGSLIARAPHFPPRAKRVIHFFLNGGPSHVDTFDHKPLLAKYAGLPLGDNLRTERKTGAAMPSPFKFRQYGQSGIEVSELFAKTASQHIDDIAVIRSMYAQVPNHEPSLMLMNCGDSVQPRPSMGAWILYGLGTENQNLPGFVAMCPNGLPIKDNENWQSAFLPGAYQGTYIDTQHKELSKLIENIEHPQIATDAQRRQLNLLAQTECRTPSRANRSATGCPDSVVRTGLSHAAGCRRSI